VSQKRVAIGIDLGGTNAKVGVVDGDGQVVAFDSGATNPERGPQVLVAEVVMLIDRVLEGVGLTRADVIGVGLGTPGPLSARTGTVIKAANLPGWVQVPLRMLFARALDLPVVLDNDANVAAYGEWWVGAGREWGDLVLLTLGTGVGGGVVLDGKVVQGHFENAAELGHMIVMPGGLPCNCGQRGCLEQYASAAAVARRVMSAIKDGETSSLAEAVARGEELDALAVEKAARAGDALSLSIWDEACYYLAVACVNIQHAFNPACVVLGGGMAGAGEFLLERVRGHFEGLKWHLHRDYPEILPAQLGYRAGVIGAAGYAWREQA